MAKAKRKRTSKAKAASGYRGEFNNPLTANEVRNRLYAVEKHQQEIISKLETLYTKYENTGCKWQPLGTN